MFARVNYNRSIRHTLGYNERKLRQGQAQRLLAANFLKDTNNLTQKDMLRRFQRLNGLHSVAKTNTLHISLSFHPSDQLDDRRMTDIARAYMQRLNLDKQPFLVYRHLDTGHPHMHIVSNLIQPDGTRIDLGPILHYRSRQCAKELEQEFSLSRFHNRDDPQAQKLQPTAPHKVIYGEPHRKEAIKNVVDHVIEKYKFTSLSEFNAVLGLYNVKAKPVGARHDLTQAQGLVYHSLDEKGQYIGLPFKASSFPSQPTIKRLQQQFALHAQGQQDQLNQLKASVDWALAGKPADWEAFNKALAKEKIHAVPEKGRRGVWQGLNYVDTRSRLAVSGESLGDRYTLDAIRARLDQNQQLNLEQSQTQHLRQGLKSGIQ
ncbi:MAG: relaxase/mobilization nuclease domain-containing protein [Bacteroidota bacterium]|nr:relaxase/mobilization nuclease domain-containing protein [Bacteroidota bacterium]